MTNEDLALLFSLVLWLCIYLHFIYLFIYFVCVCVYAHACACSCVAVDAYVEARGYKISSSVALCLIPLRVSN